MSGAHGRYVELTARDCAILAGVCAMLRPKAPKLFLGRVAMLSKACARVTGGPSFEVDAILAEQALPYFAAMMAPRGGAEPLAQLEARLNFPLFSAAWEALPDPTFEEHTAFEKIAEVVASITP